MYSLHELRTLLPCAELKLQHLMHVEKVRIALKHPEKEELFIIQQNGSYQSYPLDCGIVGKVITTGESENISNGYGSPVFNGLIDIETSLPLFCMPIKHPSSNKTIGAVEVVNVKGIQSLTYLKRPNIDALGKETLEFFCKNLAQAIINCYQWEK